MFSNRFRAIIVLTIYLTVSCKIILKTNGNISKTSLGYLKRSNNAADGWKVYLLTGRHSFNKESSSSIKSIRFRWPATKLSFSHKYGQDQERIIDASGSSDYFTENEKNILTESKTQSQSNETQRQLVHSNETEELLSDITRRSNGAPSKTRLFTAGNKGYNNYISSADISRLEVYGSDVNRASNCSNMHILNKTCNNSAPNSSHREDGYSYQIHIQKLKFKSKRTGYSVGTTLSSVKLLKTNESVVLDEKEIRFSRIKRDLDLNNQSAQNIARKRNPTGSEIYEKLLESIMNYLNMSLDDANYTYSLPDVVKAKCPDVIEDLYGNLRFSEDGNVYCNSSWDHYSCWPRTLAGTYAVIPCPGYLPGIDGKDNATKYCHENGTWASKAVYDFCLDGKQEDIPDENINDRATRLIYNVGFSVSTLTLLIALFIFLYFRSLRCLRNSIHCHLIVSFIFMNAMWIIMRHTLIPIRDSQHLWLIKVEVVLFNYSQGTNFFWMFVEGLYLHVIIVWTYSADKIKLRYLFVIGWIFPAIFIVAWIVVMQSRTGSSSGLPDSLEENGAEYDYIYITPILFVLFANIIFLSTIIWVLITKLRASHSLETRQYRKAVKATVILFPLLGITYVLFIVPPSNHPEVHVVFNYINAILQSLQGFFVAVFYCFLNGEVKGVLKKKLLRFNDARSLSTKYTKTSVAWTRGSRDYTPPQSSGNGVLRNNSKQQSLPEQIPLNATNGFDDEEAGTS